MGSPNGRDEDRRRICVVLVISNLEYGGAQRQVVELANAMDPRRYDVHICSLSDYVPLARELNDRERRLHVIQKRHKYDVTVMTRLAGLLRELEADVVHGFLFDAVIAVRGAGRRAGTPLVIGSERNTDYPIPTSHRIAYRLTRSWVDLIIANSNAGAAFNQRMLGHDASQYRVVHNGVSTTRFAPGPDGPGRQDLGLADGEPVVGMFASFKPQKNHMMLFRVAQRVRGQHPDVRFMCVGDELHRGIQSSGGYHQEMLAAIESMGLTETVLCPGNRDDVRTLYNVCSLTALTSVREGTPNVVLESLACGVPAVVTNVSDNAEIVPDGRVGFVVSVDDDEAMADRICRLLGDAELRERMSREARAWIEANYSTQRLAEKTGAIYETELQKRGVV